MDLPEYLLTLDTETTGVDVYNDRIVTAFAALVDTRGTIHWMEDWIIDPVIDIPEGATAVHGITTEYAREYGEIASVGIKGIIDALSLPSRSGYPLVVYNAPYDLTLLNAEAERWNLEPFVPGIVYDPLVIDKGVDKWRKGKRTLSAAAEVYGIPWVGDAHDASADAIMSAKIAYKLLERPEVQNAFDTLGSMSVQREWKRQQAESLEEYLRRSDPSVVVERGWPIYD